MSSKFKRFVQTGLGNDLLKFSHYVSWLVSQLQMMDTILKRHVEYCNSLVIDKLIFSNSASDGCRVHFWDKAPMQDQNPLGAIGLSADLSQRDSNRYPISYTAPFINFSRQTLHGSLRSIQQAPIEYLSLNNAHRFCFDVSCYDGSARFTYYFQGYITD